MKRLIFGFVFMMILASIASAQCDNDNQTIMRLYRENNSHGALWNETIYSETICYEDIFGENFIGANAHNCDSDGRNIILRLNKEFNAHAEKPDGTNYNIKVCHKGVEDCEVRTSCRSGQKAIAYLNDLTNAHISKSLGGDFDKIVCCYKKGTSPGPPGPPEEEDCDDARFEGCGYYKSRVACENDKVNGEVCYAAISDLGCQGSDCKCVWTSEGCVVSYTGSGGEGSGGGSGWGGWTRPDCKYTCQVKTTQGQCINGFMTVEVKATAIPRPGYNCSKIVNQNPPDCESKTISDVPCGFAETELPFFGGWQFVISVIGVALIYVIFRKKFR